MMLRIALLLLVMLQATLSIVHVDTCYYYSTANQLTCSTTVNGRKLTVDCTTVEQGYRSYPVLAGTYLIAQEEESGLLRLYPTDTIYRWDYENPELDYSRIISLYGEMLCMAFVIELESEECMKQGEDLLTSMNLPPPATYEVDICSPCSFGITCFRNACWCGNEEKQVRGTFLGTMKVIE